MTEEKAKPAIHPNWTPPPVYIGQRVLHFNSRSDHRKWMRSEVVSNEIIRPSPSIVVGRGDRQLHLRVTPAAGSLSTVEKSGVRHVTDPDESPGDVEKRGFWDYDEQTRDFWAMKAEVEAMKDAIATLSELVAALSKKKP